MVGVEAPLEIETVPIFCFTGLLSVQVFVPVGDKVIVPEPFVTVI